MAESACPLGFLFRKEAMVGGFEYSSYRLFGFLFVELQQRVIRICRYKRKEDIYGLLAKPIVIGRCPVLVCAYSPVLDSSMT